MSNSRKIDELALSRISSKLGDVSTEKMVEFFFYFPTEMDATMAQVELVNLQFQCSVSKSPTKNDWLCFATKKMLVSEERFSELRRWMENLSAKHNGTYDGWGMEV